MFSSQEDHLATVPFDRISNAKDFLQHNHAQPFFSKRVQKILNGLSTVRPSIHNSRLKSGLTRL